MLLVRRDRETTHVRLRGHHPLRPGIQSRSPRTPFYHSRRARRGPDARSRNTACATPDGYHTHTVWPHPLSLATTHGVSFPAGTEMFHFPAYPPPKAVPAHDGRRVPPFGNPRIKALLAAPRGLSQPHTSFIGTVCQGIHHTPFTGNHTAARDKASKHRTTDLRTNDHKTIRTKNKTSTRRSSSEKTVNKKRIFLARVHSPVLKPPPRPSPEPANPTRGTDGTRYGEPMPDPKARWRSGNPKACPYHTRATDLFHTSNPTDGGPSGRGATPGANRALYLRRKEVIQPHLPVRLPCYDLVPITSLTLDGSPHKG